MISGSDILKDVAFCEAVLNEKFIKGDDPTMVIGKFVSDADGILSSIQKDYNKKAGDRNVIVDSTISNINDLIALAQKAKSELKDAEPEDTNGGVAIA